MRKSLFFLLLFFREALSTVISYHFCTTSDYSSGCCMENWEWVPCSLEKEKKKKKKRNPEVCFHWAHPKFRRCPKSKAEHTVAIKEVVWGPAIGIGICLFVFAFVKKQSRGLNPPSDNTAFVTFDININLQKSRHPTAPEKRNSLQSLLCPGSGTNPALSSIFFSSGGRGQGERISVSQAVSWLSGHKEVQSCNNVGTSLPFRERDRTKNKASQIAVHEGGAKPQAPVPCTICGRWEVGGAREKGEEDRQGTVPGITALPAWISLAH